MRAADAFRTCAPGRRAAPSPGTACPAFCRPQPLLSLLQGDGDLKARQFSRWNKAHTQSLHSCRWEGYYRRSKNYFGVRARTRVRQVKHLPWAQNLRSTENLGNQDKRYFNVISDPNADNSHRNIGHGCAPGPLGRPSSIPACGPCRAARPSPGATSCCYTPCYRQLLPRHCVLSWWLAFLPRCEHRWDPGLGQNAQIIFPSNMSEH